MVYAILSVCSNKREMMQTKLTLQRGTSWPLTYSNNKEVCHVLFSILNCPCKKLLALL